MRWFISLFALIGLSACHAAPPVETHGQVDKLIVIDQQVGQGVIAKPGVTVGVHYTGWLYDDRAKDKHGKKFDSSRDRNEVFAFHLGAGEVIPGWDQGVTGMKVGGHRILYIPATLGYGAEGAGDDIPPNASLVFDVELMYVKP